jgi:hypothetical protein
MNFFRDYLFILGEISDEGRVCTLKDSLKDMFEHKMIHLVRVVNKDEFYEDTAVQGEITPPLINLTKRRVA